MTRRSSAPVVLVDVRPLQGADALRGIGTYVRGLVQGLDEITAFRGAIAGLTEAGLPPVDDCPFPVFRVHRRYTHTRFASWEDAVALPRDLENIRPNVFHATSLRLPGKTDTRVVATVHDLIPWALGGRAYLGERVRFGLARRLLRRVDLVLAVSENTARDVERLAMVPSARIRTVAEGVSPIFMPRVDAVERVRTRWGVRRPYAIYVGAIDPRKAPESLVAVSRRLEDLSVDFLIAGPAPTGETQLGSTRRLGRVTDVELADLLSAARALVYPSRYEGFGLPLLEAMAAGCPVVAYSNSSIPEVVGNAAFLVEDGDEQALLAAVTRVVTDHDLAASLRTAGIDRAGNFTWKRTAEATIRAYRTLLS